MTRRRRPVLIARAWLLALGLALAGSFVAACQADKPPVNGARQPTPAEAVKLITAIGTYEQAALLEAALQRWTMRERILSARHNWDHFQALVRAQANRAARLEFLAFLTATRTPVAGSVGALGGWGALAAPRIVLPTMFELAAPNQCAFVLPGQEPLSRPALRWLRTGEAVEEQEPPLTQQLLDALEADPGPIPMTEAEIQAYEQWRSENSAPIPMTEEESAWAAQQRADSGAPYPMDDDEIEAVEEAAADAPPFTEELVDWIEQYPEDSAPVPMTPEEVAWAEQQRADSGAPYPMTDEEAGWVKDWESVDPGPIPMTEEEIAWAEQQRAANDGAPVTMTEAEIQAYEQWVQDGAPVPMTDEEIAAYGEWVDDGAPIPMTEEEIAWSEQQRSDTDPGPIPMTEEEIQALEEWGSETDPGPIPMTEEEIAWAEQQRAESTAPVPMTDEEIRAVEEAARNRTLALSEEDWDWILEQLGRGSVSSTPQPTPQRCDWFVDESHAQGHVTGQKCGGAAGKWILEGTYHPRQAPTFEGEQKWTITIGSDWRTGTFTYATKAHGQFAGAPVTVILSGYAEGTVTLTIQDDGIAHMEFVETKHIYVTTTDLGGDGHNINVALERYSQDWAVGGTC